MFCFISERQTVPSLTELAAKCVASHIPFELVEHVYPPVPEQLQLRIAFWSFPDNEEDIRLYSCLANGSADEFTRGENLYRNHFVKDPLQIGKFWLTNNIAVITSSVFFMYIYKLFLVLLFLFSIITLRFNEKVHWLVDNWRFRWAKYLRLRSCCTL